MSTERQLVVWWMGRCAGLSRVAGFLPEWNLPICQIGGVEVICLTAWQIGMFRAVVGKYI